MKLLIDGDGCPSGVVNAVVSEAAKRNLRALLFCDTSHIFNMENAEVIVVGKGADSVDFAIINRVDKGDIIITQDYALGAMCLSKGCYCLNQNGFEYTAENIDRLLFQRHISRELRRSGKRSAHIKKRSADDDRAFRECLIRLLDKLGY